MSESRGTPRRGSSFGPGPRRGTDPEGGEKSAWKGLCGPSGLNLDHSRIPSVQQMVYDTLTPLLVASQEPIPLSLFTQKCCDVLLPLLEKEQELGAHEFKSQWGRLNEFVCPTLARLAGIEDSGFSRENKTVRIDLTVEASSAPAPPRRTAAAPGLTTKPAAAAAAAAAAAMAPPAHVLTAPAVPAVPAVPQAPSPSPLPVPVQLPTAAAGHGLQAHAGGLPVLTILCAYCQGPHSMRHCGDFHAMLQSIYQAGYQQGLAAAQQLAQQPAAMDAQ